MAEAQQLYPTFSVPNINLVDEQEDEGLKAGPLFDFNEGDYVTDGAKRVPYVDGRDEYVLWCVKALHTQKGSCESYPDFGIEEEEALAQPDATAVQLDLERTISEALLQHPCTEKVHEFVFTHSGDTMTVTFVVQPKLWDAFDIEMNIVL